MNKFLLVLVTATMIGSYVSAESSDSTMMKSDKSATDGTMMKADTPAASDGTMMKSDTPAASDGTMMKSEDTMTKSDNDMMVADDDKKMSVDPMDSTAYNLKGLGRQVMAFTTEAAAQKLAKTQAVVYFFAATWCPNCQETYKDIKSNFRQIPAKVTILFVNYDKATALKKKYGITQQHSYVLIGTRGEAKKTWSGSSTVMEIVQKATMM